ncbi:PREDICTED: alpha-barbatene synthase-like isoform X2 [Tarenaya hassleriana]|uniref:alpha-barbatene synthase-like isoform X2 n=1 Tax=Tarenaya hassleriana TaxID=28532 RepID=UPI00053C1E5E|nr:PREDICTED: alpha-barbatene synthase-like isoform X2 [Tarenaya hassleriana]
MLSTSLLSLSLIRWVVNMEAEAGSDHGRVRPFVTLPPSEWDEHFLAVSLDASEMGVLEKEMEALKPKVRDMLMSSPSDTKSKLCFIHLLVSLGISFHFENEIEETLKHAFDTIEDKITDKDDLYTVSAMFLVFRSYRYKMSPGVFETFKGEDGRFKTSLVRDVKGMLSLYEAANWGTVTEDIMDEALSFTSTHLESLPEETSPHMSKHIKTVLDLPQRQNMEILAVREYISFYEHEDDHDETLLKFSKLCFRFLQMHCVQELKALSKWWKDLGLESKLPPYFRNNMVQCYFNAVPLLMEPHFSRARIALAKLYRCFTIMDDTCDRYASLHEVTTLVDCVQRWDLDGIAKLPDYMKIVFKLFWDVYHEIEREVRLDGRSYSAQAMLDECKRMARANLACTKWVVPTFEEYMKVGKVEFGTEAALACGFVCMGQIAGKEAYDWLNSRPNIIQSVTSKARLLNDITGFQDDMSRGYAATGINVYMKQYGVTEEEAFREFRKMVRATEKITTEEFLNATVVPRKILMQVINFERSFSTTYAHGEGFTNCTARMKENISSLFVHLISL